MTEEYLQFIWNQGRVPFPQLKLTSGEELIVKKTGAHNTQLSGPDFLEASVVFGGLEFHGAIEIHVNASDWYKHGHHLDDSYNSVILHVVYNHDTEILQNNRILPTLELRELIDPGHLKNYRHKQLLIQDFPCKNGINELPSIYLNSMKSKALIDKYTAKMERLFGGNLKEHEPDEVLYRLICSAFGMKVNQYGFERLAKRVSWNNLKRLSAHQMYNLFIAESGLFFKDSINSAEKVKWNFRGTRPANFPVNRIGQLSQMLERCPPEKIRTFLNQDTPKNYRSEMIKFINEPSPLISAKFLDHLLINAIGPFLWWLEEGTEAEGCFERAIELLEQLPPENNVIMRKWKNVEVGNENAFDSQGLLGLFGSHCSAKKCLSCEVGIKLLNRPE